MKIETITISKPNDLFTMLIEYGDGWVFRGQSNAEWGLSRSIERIQLNGFNDDVLRNHEAYSRLKFESVAHHYLDYQNLPNTDLSWLSLMQHHGVPTRLIDFSTMPFVALFFAIDGIRLDEIDDKGNSSLWCLPSREMNDVSLGILSKRERHGYDELASKFDRKSDTFFEEYIDAKCHNLLWITEPRNLNLRLRQQGGTFLISDDLSTPIFSQIEHNQSYNDIVAHKIIIPHSIVTDLYSTLGKMHISSSQIYPGLDGIGRDIGVELLYLISTTPNKSTGKN